MRVRESRRIARRRVGGYRGPTRRGQVGGLLDDVAQPNVRRKVELEAGRGQRRRGADH